MSIWRFLVTDLPVVSSDSEIVTFEPLTVTLPVMWSPAEMLRSRLTGPAGTSSYHAWWLPEPEPLQSISVPVCSSACD